MEGCIEDECNTLNWDWDYCEENHAKNDTDSEGKDDFILCCKEERKDDNDSPLVTTATMCLDDFFQVFRIIVIPRFIYIYIVLIVVYSYLVLLR